VRAKIAHWSQAWKKYEAAMEMEHASYEALEEAYRVLEGYKVFAMDSDEEDIAFVLAMQTIRKQLSSMGVSIGSTVEED
jgi:hypothetical protein